MFIGIKAFGEDVYNLIATRDEPDLNVSSSNSFTNKIKINFNKLDVSMIN